MNKYFVRTTDGNSGEIEADGYVITDGLVRFWRMSTNENVAVFNTVHLVSLCLMEKLDKAKNVS
jgi:hypothetical protein